MVRSVSDAMGITFQQACELPYDKFCLHLLINNAETRAHRDWSTDYREKLKREAESRK